MVSVDNTYLERQIIMNLSREDFKTLEKLTDLDFKKYIADILASLETSKQLVVKDFNPEIVIIHLQDFCKSPWNYRQRETMKQVWTNQNGVKSK